MGIHERLRKSSQHTTTKVEKEKPHRPQHIFHIVTKNMEKPHVAEDMHPSSMHEHARDQRARTAQMSRKQHTGHHAMPHHFQLQRIFAKSKLMDKYRNVDRY